MNDHVIELLPWYVNGRLSLAETENVVKHLERCAVCAAELDMQRALHSAINTNDKVGIAPQPSFNKLWRRIVDEQHEHESFLVEKPAQPHGKLSTSTLSAFKQWFIHHWMPIAMITQSAAVIVLAAMLVTKPTTSNEYRTVTDSPAITGPVFHVVFDDNTRLVDIKSILTRTELQVVSGPTPAGVYSMTPLNHHNSLEVAQVIKSLRDDPRVRFAELSYE